MVTLYSSSASSLSQPEVLIQEQVHALISDGASARCFALVFTHQAYYLPQPTELSLVALVALSLTESRVDIQGAILEDSPLVRQQILNLPADRQAFAAFASDYQIPWLCFTEPLRLAPVHIAKPWGQEIWYSGIEARGQSAVTAQGFCTPLPWIMSLMPKALAAGREKDLILLKILDPLAEEVYGDLYFELHDQKQEVYIVTRIDERAWPTGEGAIRLGFNTDLRAQYPDDEAFKRAYLETVSDYRDIRCTIDQLLDQQRLACGIDLSAPVDAQTLITWQRELPPTLVQEELIKRRQMDQFTALHPLRQGDVIKVPCRVPHALQHGVRTVEFQTPVYERKILSFAQKVLTQAEWDTQVALRNIILEANAQPAVDVLHASEQVRIERVVTFDDFEVRRLHLQARQSTLLEATKDYALLMLLSGDVMVHNNGSTQSALGSAAINVAFFLPASGGEYRVEAGNSAAIVLLAMPRMAR